MKWEFQGAGRILVASLEGLDEPQVLDSGKRGWYRVSAHILWRLGWCRMRTLVSNDWMWHWVSMSRYNGKTCTVESVIAVSGVD